MSDATTHQRILLAKVGLDGHDRGIKVVARGLRDAGFHVIYSGLWQSVDSVAQAAQDEDVDWLGVSILNGAHMTLVPALIGALESHRAGVSGRIGVIVGGIIPRDDEEKLKQLGVRACFGPGTAIETIVEFLSRSTGPVMRQPPNRDEIPQLVARLERRDFGALRRLLTLAANGWECELLAAALRHRPQEHARVFALTGSGGVGKSSLLHALTTENAREGEWIGVLACDPESPLTGGALLGDRCRIAGTDPTDRVFVRSLSTVSGQQGVAQHIGLMLDVMQAFGFDWIFVETVGAGQGDVAVRQIADVVVLILQPQTGDELQWEKAGILELADLVVVNKADLPGADQTVADVTQQIGLADGRGVSVIKTSVASGEGIAELCDAIANVPIRPA